MFPTPESLHQITRNNHRHSSNFFISTLRVDLLSKSYISERHFKMNFPLT